jgi:predicted TIM-barrel fold metal-dependent hydrolase
LHSDGPIDSHLHLQSGAEAPKLLRAMDAVGIYKGVLLGSPLYTITLNPNHRFTHYHQNNMAILGVAKQHPDRFLAWPTLNPLDGKKNQELIQQYRDAGATGIKLFVGHGAKLGSPTEYVFHLCPIDSEVLLPVYQECSDLHLPMCIHVNTTSDAPGFAAEFERVLDLFPELRVIAPHWMLATKRPRYISQLLARYANLYTDISFGRDNLLSAGFQRISDSIELFRSLVTRHAERILFATDLVCTEAAHKTTEWLARRFTAYLNLLSASEFETPVVPGVHLKGLASGRRCYKES